MDLSDRVAVVRYRHQPALEEILIQVTALSDQGARLRMWVFESGVGFSSDDLRKMVEHVRAQKVPAVRTAIVSAADLGFGIFRMFQAYAGDLDTQIQIFRDEQDAHRWLEDGASQAE